MASRTANKSKERVCRKTRGGERLGRVELGEIGGKGSGRRGRKVVLAMLMLGKKKGATK